MNNGIAKKLRRVAFGGSGTDKTVVKYTTIERDAWYLVDGKPVKGKTSQRVHHPLSKRAVYKLMKKEYKRENNEGVKITGKEAKESVDALVVKWEEMHKTNTKR